jgi:riboflavin kinase/FMN adenylyltransferase
MIHKHLSEFEHSPKLHVVIGSFDGVHSAHQQLINKAINTAKQNKEKSLIFSFDPLPKEYFLKEQFKGSLLTIEQKRNILEQFGADYTVIVDFESVKDYTEKQFIDILLSKADQLVIYSGKDFRIGAKDKESYSGSQVEYVVLDDILIANKACRSSTIRELILDGDITLANTMLNREYSIHSYTVPGNKIGRSINFPTINVLPTKQIIPKAGVYFGEIKIYHHTYPAAIYVGTRPTVHGEELRIESHIIADFPHGDVPPNTPAEVIFIKRTFDEKSFKSLEELKEMLYNYKSISSGLATERYQNKMDRLS